MSNCYLGVGIKECLPCGGELVVLHGNCIFKVGRERGTRGLISSAFSAPLSPLTPASFKALHSTGAVTKSKESAADSILCAHPVQSSRSPPWRSPQGQQQVGSLVGAYLGCGRIGVHLTPRENTLGHFGLNLVTVSSLRCGAQRCIPFTPYFTFDHFSGSSVVVGPQDSRAGGFCPEQVGKSYLFGKIRPARGVVRASLSVSGAKW